MAQFSSPLCVLFLPKKKNNNNNNNKNKNNKIEEDKRGSISHFEAHSKP